MVYSLKGGYKHSSVQSDNASYKKDIATQLG